VDNLTTSLGIKLASLVAGFAGGVVSLAFVQALTRAQAIGAVAVGSLTAAYMTPAIVQYFNIGPGYENGVAFLIGLLAMQVIPLVQKLAVRRVTDRIENGQTGGQPTTKGETP
jgi:hypothetical protein